jgi:hypothetical protein
MPDLETLNRWLELAAHLITIGGVPVAIVLFVGEKRRERREREEHAFDDLDDAYCDFMRLCLKHPEADVFELPMDEPSRPSASQLRTEHTLFAILISLFERAFLMFEEQHQAFRRRQWDGWVLFMKRYSNRGNFQRVWGSIGKQFDTRFQRFVDDELIKRGA